MKKSELINLGSITARSGFENERDVAIMFEHWDEYPIAKSWLQLLGIDPNMIEGIKTKIISGQKTDVQVLVNLKNNPNVIKRNLQVKLVTNESGFNQVDKRWVDNYVILFGIPPKIAKLLKLYTGEIKPIIKNPRDSRRMFMDEFPLEDQKIILDFFRKNKNRILQLILAGEGEFAADFMMVVRKTGRKYESIICPMEQVLSHYGSQEVVITKRGNLSVGKIGMQRKGGDNGRKSAQMLQFKADPTQLFIL
jgi:hypothetical protein